MQLSTVSSLSKRKGSDALFLPFFDGAKPAFSEKGLSALFKAPVEAKDFTGKAGEVVVVYPGKGSDVRVVLIGLGNAKEVTVEGVRRHYGKALSAVKEKAKTLTVQLPESIDHADDCLDYGAVEGILLASYVWDTFLPKKKKVPTKATFVGASKALLNEVAIIGGAVAFTRDLVMGNADEVTPTYLGQVAKEMAKSRSTMKATVFTPERIEKEGMHLISAVARASSTPPAFITLEYKGNPKKKEVTAIVGKGVTYDTGGLAIKPVSGMLTMRDDMSGAAVVLGVMKAIAELELPINVVGVIGATENSIGPKSYKHGDVYDSHKGLTVEVTNTDAEGRLVLADALSYVEKTYAPKRIINLATLTGGVIIALGEEIAGVMGNDDDLAFDLIEAGEATGERLWQFPLSDEYKELLRSKIADVKNSGDRKASSIQGGMFLKNFVSKAEWAHIDIAGVAFKNDRKSYQPVEATGFGVRLLVHYLSECV